MSEAPFRAAVAVLFDLDGTLTASAPGILAAVRYALREIGEPIPPPEVLDRFIGPPLVQSFRDLCGMAQDRAWEAVTTYRVYYAHRGQYEGSVYPGIPELLGALQAAGRTTAVATSKAEVFARSTLEHFGLAAHLGPIVGSELDGRRTDKAELLTESMRRLAVGPSDCVMIGDRCHDMRGAAAVGMARIGALWGYGSAEELTAAGADALASDPAHLRELLGC